MSKKQMDGHFLDYPLCCLIYVNNIPKKLIDIVFYCVVENAYKSKDDYKILARIMNSDFSFVKAKDFNVMEGIHYQIAIAAQDLDIQIESYAQAIKNWSEIKQFVNDYELKYGKDAFCRMGKKLTIEVIEGLFPFRNYCVLAAIHSILGKKTLFARITYENISYRMHGFKKKTIAQKEEMKTQYLSDRQIKNCVDKLRMKNLIRVFVFNYRQKFYSTKIKYEDRLRELVAKEKLKNAEKQFNVEDRRASEEIKRQIKQIRMTGKQNTLYMKSE